MVRVFAAKPKVALDGSGPSSNCVCRVGGFLNLEANSQCVGAMEKSTSYGVGKFNK